MTPIPRPPRQQVNPLTYIGIDNGTTGTIGIYVPMTGEYELHKTPTKSSLNYQKTKEKWVTRIDVDKLRTLLKPHKNARAVLERPMINSMRFNASVSAARSLEAVLIILEELQIPYEYIDSKEWQTRLFPSGTVSVKRVKGKSSKTSSDLKKLGIEIAKRNFPKLQIPDKCDADGILIAFYASIRK